MKIEYSKRRKKIGFRFSEEVLRKSLVCGVFLQANWIVCAGAKYNKKYIMEWWEFFIISENLQISAPADGVPKNINIMKLQKTREIKK